MEKLKLLWLVAAMILMFATAGLLYLWLDRSNEVFLINNSTVEEEKPEEWDYLSELYLSDDEMMGENEVEEITKARLLFFGDLMLDRNVGAIIENKGLDSLLANLRTESFFSDQDIISANLEGAVTNDGDHYSPNNAYDFAFKPELIAQLKEYGFNYFSLANNHTTDQGQKGLDESRQNLQALQVSFSGSGDATIDKFSRQDLKVKNQTIALIGLSMVYNNFDKKQAQSLISQASQETDFVVVNVHWGNEYEHNFNIYQQQVGHELVDAGADIIIGHHPHVVQGLEIYKNKPIFYSLGNFIFDQYFSDATQEGLVVGLEIFEDRLNIALFPFITQESSPSFLKNEEASKFIEKFISWSELTGTWPDRVQSGEWVMSR